MSDRAPVATLEERMDDVRAVMDAAKSERAVLFGSSEGGPTITGGANFTVALDGVPVLDGEIAKPYVLLEEVAEAQLAGTRKDFVAAITARKRDSGGVTARRAATRPAGGGSAWGRGNVSLNGEIISLFFRSQGRYGLPGTPGALDEVSNSGDSADEYRQ